MDKTNAKDGQGKTQELKIRVIDNDVRINKGIQEYVNCLFDMDMFSDGED